jgi:hypothetical protein
VEDDFDPAMSPVIDPDVSDSYQRVAVESVPSSLDRMVLELSRRASRSWFWPSISAAWARPVAFSAMLILSFAAFLQFIEVDLESGWDMADSASEQSNNRTDRASDFADAVESTGQRLRKLDHDTESLSSNNKPVVSTSASASDNPGFSAKGPVVQSEHCAPYANDSADAWWQCILILQREGRIDSARREIELLHTAHPSFDTNQ